MMITSVTLGKKNSVKYENYRIQGVAQRQTVKWLIADGAPIVSIISNSQLRVMALAKKTGYRLSANGDKYILIRQCSITVLENDEVIGPCREPATRTTEGYQLCEKHGKT